MLAVGLAKARLPKALPFLSKNLLPLSGRKKRYFSRFRDFRMQHCRKLPEERALFAQIRYSLTHCCHEHLKSECCFSPIQPFFSNCVLVNSPANGNYIYPDSNRFKQSGLIGFPADESPACSSRFVSIANVPFVPNGSIMFVSYLPVSISPILQSLLLTVVSPFSPGFVADSSFSRHSAYPRFCPVDKINRQKAFADCCTGCVPNAYRQAPSPPCRAVYAS